MTAKFLKEKEANVAIVFSLLGNFILKEVYILYELYKIEESCVIVLMLRCLYMRNMRRRK